MLFSVRSADERKLLDLSIVRLSRAPFLFREETSTRAEVAGCIFYTEVPCTFSWLFFLIIGRKINPIVRGTTATICFPVRRSSKRNSQSGSRWGLKKTSLRKEKNKNPHAHILFRKPLSTYYPSNLQMVS